ncbi:UBQLN1, partial [Cordylochernes scorpioides]
MAECVQLMNNPESLRQLMDNPMVQSLLNNPDYMRQMITSNPQMQQIMERNPELNHMLNNPDLLRQTMEVVRNPAMLQEMMRTQDRALSNLESFPGGYNALRRMYTELQEPMMNAAQEQLGLNPFTALLNNNTGNSTDSSRQGTENREPLPNPWASTTSASTTPGTTAPPRSSLPLGNMMGGGNPGMQNFIQQMMQNPQMVQNLMTAPYMQNVIQMLSQSPDLAQSVLGSNPLLADSSPEIRAMLPTMIQQLQNPELQNMITNPQAVQALLQIYQGFEQLTRVAPGSLPGLIPQQPAATTTTNTTSTTTSTTADTTPASGDTSATSRLQLSQLMAQLLSSSMAPQQTSQPQQQQQPPPEERYRSQLEQLTAMGFVNREANLQ